MFDLNRRLLVAAPLALILAFVGCDSGSRSSTPASTTASAPSTPATPTPAAPALPANSPATTTTTTTTTQTGPTLQAQVYITDGANDQVVLVDTNTNTIVDKISVGSYPTDIAYNDAKTKAYVSCVGDASLWIIDTATNQATSVDLKPTFFGSIVSFLSFLDTVIGYGTLPAGIDVYTTTTGVDKVYVTCLLFTAQYDALTNNVDYIIDSAFTQLFSNLGTWATQNILSFLGLGGSTSNITTALSNPINGFGAAKVACGTDYTFITNLVTSNVTVIDSATGDLVRTVDVGLLPIGVAVTGWGEAYVACVGDNSVWAVDGGSSYAYEFKLQQGFGALEVSADDGDKTSGSAFVSCILTGNVETVGYYGSTGAINTGGSPLNLNQLTGIGNNGVSSLFGNSTAGATVGGILSLLVGANGSGGSSNSALNTILGLITGGSSSSTASGVSNVISSLFSGGNGTNNGLNGFVSSLLNLVLGQLGLGSYSSIATGSMSGFGVLGLDVTSAGDYFYTHNFITGDGSLVEVSSQTQNNASTIVSPGYSGVDLAD